MGWRIRKYLISRFQLKHKKITLGHIKINEKQGKNYAKDSGDKNKIHIDKIYGYNSIFGKNIVHGTLIISKFLKLIDFKKKNFFLIEIDFRGPFYYNLNIFVQLKKYKNLIKYNLVQENIIKGIITLNLNENFNNRIDKFKYKKKKIFYIKNQKKKSEIDLILGYLSKYVGMNYPGQNSLISNIKIYFSNKKKFEINNKILVRSEILKPGFPIIINTLKYKNFFIYFETLFRPVIKKKSENLNNLIKNHIQKIKENFLIIGGSQGIGNSVLKIINNNKKVKKFATYFKNKINYKNKNLYIKKIDIFKDKEKILRIIKDNLPLRIYYFPTSKIYFENKLDAKTIVEYKKLFYEIPMAILKSCKNKNILFFYPSTTNIDINKNSVYSKIKLKAENKFLSYSKKNKMILKIHRFPAIYSRQSISILNKNPPTLFEYLGKNKKIINSIFPIKFDNLENNDKEKFNTIP